MPPGFDRFESFGLDELTAKHCYFRCSRPPDVDGIKMFDKDDQATKRCFLCPGRKTLFFMLMISHLFQQGLYFSSWPPLFTLRMFLIRLLL